MDKSALVTGAASGLGFEFAKLLAGDGYNLILVDVDQENLEKVRQDIISLYSIQVQTLPFDLSESKAAASVYEAIEGEPIEVLINNAGFGLFGPFVETNWQTEKDMMHLHILTPTHLTKLVLPDMIKAGRGRIMNVSSLAAFQPGPLMSVYYASKAFILSFSEALSNEVKGSGVTVTVLCPGLTMTNFQQKAAALSNSKVSGSSFATVSAEEVARNAYKAMMKGKRLVIPGFFNKLTARLPRLVPRGFTLRMVRRIQENLRK